MLGTLLYVRCSPKPSPGWTLISRTLAGLRQNQQFWRSPALNTGAAAHRSR